MFFHALQSRRRIVPRKKGNSRWGRSSTHDLPPGGQLCSAAPVIKAPAEPLLVFIPSSSHRLRVVCFLFPNGQPCDSRGDRTQEFGAWNRGSVGVMPPSLLGSTSTSTSTSAAVAIANGPAGFPGFAARALSEAASWHLQTRRRVDTEAPIGARFSTQTCVMLSHGLQRHCLLPLLWFALWFGGQASASLGDRLPEFRGCVAVSVWMEGERGEGSEDVD
jgi:hypothetical protein